MAVPLSKDLLRAEFVGKTLHEVITPAAVLDLAKVEVNCNLMLEAAQRLQLSWRAHIKTHKTEELTRLQVGDASSSPVNLIVSTILEAERVVPLLQEYRDKGRQINVLYSFPLYPSSTPRLAAISKQLGPRAVTVMVDHVDQVAYLDTLTTESGGIAPLVFLKVNVGSDRAGVVPGTSTCTSLITALLASEAAGASELLGVYSHAGHSYATREDWEAMGILGAEFEGLKEVAEEVQREQKKAHVQNPSHTTHRPLVLSVGATPTATTIQHPDLDPSSSAPSHSEPTPNPNPNTNAAAQTTHLKSLLHTLSTQNLTPEVHAGVYPTLDLQQLAAHARSAPYLHSGLIALSVLADIASVYPLRGPSGETEALVNAGSLALGREPCQEMVGGEQYRGWGIVMPWGELAAEKVPVPGEGFPREHGGWEVAKISQEHGVLRWVGGADDEVPVRVGQRVRIWPNHSCITGAGHGWYLVVDSRNTGREDEIVDVWPRWNGW